MTKQYFLLYSIDKDPLVYASHSAIDIARFIKELQLEAWAVVYGEDCNDYFRNLLK